MLYKLLIGRIRKAYTKLTLYNVCCFTAYYWFQFEIPERNIRVKPNYTHVWHWNSSLWLKGISIWSVPALYTYTFGFNKISMLNNLEIMGFFQPVTRGMQCNSWILALQMKIFIFFLLHRFPKLYFQGERKHWMTVDKWRSNLLTSVRHRELTPNGPANHICFLCQDMGGGTQYGVKFSQIYFHSV